MNILFLTSTLPRATRTGSECVSQCLIDGLEYHGHAVWVVGYQRQQQDYTPNGREINVGKRYIETGGAQFYPLVWMLVALWRRLPYSFAKYYSQDYRQAVQICLQTQSIDLVILDHVQLAWVMDVVPSPLPVVLVAHNIEHQPYVLQQSRSRNPLVRWLYGREAALVQQIQDRTARQVPEIWTLTAADRAYFSQVHPTGTVRQFDIPFAIAVPSGSMPGSTPGSTPGSAMVTTPSYEIALLGSWTWGPNAAGLRWFVQHVYPLLPADWRIRVAGQGADWLTDRHANLDYCGFVPDARQFLLQAQVVAIPSVSGSGIQIKTLEAIALGSKIVATPTALRGIAPLPATVGVAETPPDFAAALIAAVSSPRAAAEQSAAIAWAEQRRQTFLQAIATAVRGARSPLRLGA